MRRLVAVAVSVVVLVFAGEGAAFAGQSVHGPPFPHVCPFESGFALVEGLGLVQSGQATEEEIDKADRNGDGLICYKIVNGSNVLLMETLTF
jgi:hypothetical protein